VGRPDSSVRYWARTPASQPKALGAARAGGEDGTPLRWSTGAWSRPKLGKGSRSRRARQVVVVSRADGFGAPEIGFAATARAGSRPRALSWPSCSGFAMDPAGAGRVAASFAGRAALRPWPCDLTASPIMVEAALASI